jgi:hypothetical protein
MASPGKKALTKQTTAILDLTGDKPLEKPLLQRHQSNPTKYHRRKGYTPEPTKKSIQWKEDEVKSFNPNSPAIPNPHSFTQQTFAVPMSNHMNNPFPLTQVPATPYLQNTFTTPMYLPMHLGALNPLLPQQITQQQYFPGQQPQLPNPFQRFPQQHNTSTRENPFGAQTPTNKNYKKI